MLIPVKDDNAPKTAVGKVLRNTFNAITGADKKEAIRKASGNPPESYLKDAQSDPGNKTNGFLYKL
jgi:hypothetical protein